MALNEIVVLPEMCDHLIDKVRSIEDCDTNRGYKVSFDVQHDRKAISFVTEAMTTREKVEVFLRQKNVLRGIYPDYHILERHQ